MGNNDIMDALKVLEKGQVLEDPAPWKVAQNWINIVTALVSIIGIFVPPIHKLLTPDVIEAAVAVVGTVNAYLTTATTDKIGV
jgi:hypothetical protein